LIASLSHPDPDWQLRMPFAVCRERALHRDRALCGAPRAREGDHEAIAERLNFMSPMCRDLLSKDFVVDANDFMGAQVTQLFAKRRRIFKIGDKYGY
jgi:hypothetical protein